MPYLGVGSNKKVVGAGRDCLEEPKLKRQLFVLIEKISNFYIEFCALDFGVLTSRVLVNI